MKPWSCWRLLVTRRGLSSVSRLPFMAWSYRTMGEAGTRRVFAGSMSGLRSGGKAGE